MRNKTVKLSWYVLVHNFNTNKIEKYNIFGVSFIEDTYKKVKNKKINNYEQLKEHIKNWAMYHYWSKSEFEIAVGGLHSKYPQEYEKIDVYTQIQPNLDIITDYVIKQMDIKFN